MTALRLCFISPEYALHPPFGGIATYTRDVGQWLAARGHDVCVVCVTRNTPPRQVHDNGVAVHYVIPRRIRPRRLLTYASRLPGLSKLHEAYSGWDLLENSLGAWLAVRQLSQEKPFDVIECVDFSGLAFWGLWPVHRARVLLRGHGILHMGSGLPHTTRAGARFHHWLEKACAKRADFILTTSEYLADSYKTELGLHHDRIASLPSGLKLSSDENPASAAARSGNTANVIVLYVGRIEYAKGADILFEALEKLYSKCSTVQCRLIGAATGDSAEQLNDFTRSNGYRVTYLGPLSQTEVYRHMSEADMLVLPSRTETLPRTLIEALAHGLPQIASTVGGIPEVVEDGVTGFLVEPDNPEALAVAIERLCVSPELRSLMAQRSRARAFERFDLEKVMPRQVEVYRALAEGRSPLEALAQ